MFGHGVEGQGKDDGPHDRIEKASQGKSIPGDGSAAEEGKGQTEHGGQRGADEDFTAVE